MSAIGKGDWVECIRNRLPHTAPPRGLVVGRVYQVDEVGETSALDENPGTPYVRLVEPKPSPGKLGFRASWFRPVLRPKADLIEQLKKPVQQSLLTGTAD